MDISLC